MSEDQKALALRETRRREMEGVSFSKGTQGGALMQPTTGRELMDMANLMASSGQMVRDFYRNNPGDCMGLIMICQPYGFNPFMVSWKTYKASKNADAPVAFEGQLVNAMVNMSAPVKGRLRYSYDGEIEDGTRRCTVTGIDRETGEEITYVSPPIKSIPTKNSPLWKGDPDQQLGYYSARAWARRHFPELLLGVYTREEIEEAPMRDVTPPKPGGLAELAQRAREQVKTGEVLDPEPEEEAHWTNSIDITGATGEADAYLRGQVDREDGKLYTDCPYEGDIDLATEWCAGWVDADKRGQAE